MNQVYEAGWIALRQHYIKCGGSVIISGDTIEECEPILRDGLKLMMDAAIMAHTFVVAEITRGGPGSYGIR